MYFSFSVTLYPGNNSSPFFFIAKVTINLCSLDPRKPPYNVFFNGFSEGMLKPSQFAHWNLLTSSICNFVII